LGGVETIDTRTHERTLLGGDILIGVNAAGMANEKFWSTMGSHLNDAMRHLDYIGLDLFPDVFHPIPHESLADATQFLLTTARGHAGQRPAPRR
jgi:hypothetical protein